jgi:hypothetical protein
MSAIEPTPLKLHWYVSVAAVLFIFVVVGIYSTRMAYDTNATDGYDQQQAAIRVAKLQKMQATDRKTLTTADWLDQTKGTIRIPIDEAMTQEVTVLQAKPVAMGSALTVVAPAAPAAATSTNAPPVAPTAPGTGAAPAATATPPASTNAPAANPNPAK